MPFLMVLALLSRNGGLVVEKGCGSKSTSALINSRSCRRLVHDGWADGCVVRALRP
ncbi:hypothetical protein Mapa_016360 [Marchantia paleacea]|nr:hypothetical protein Mapa_016360 [Marchantia paleacea]